MSLRVLIISSVFPPVRAPETGHAVFLCERLAGAGVEVHLLTTKGNDADVGLPPGVTVHAIVESWTWSGLPKLLYFIGSNRFDKILLLYIDWIYRSHPMVTFLPTLARRLCGTKNFVTQLENENGLSGIGPSHRLEDRMIRALAKRMVGRKDVDPSYGTLLRDSNHVIALSERHLDTFAMACPSVRAKAEVLPAPSFIRNPRGDVRSVRLRGRESLGLEEGQVAIIYYGFLYPAKGVETLIKAFGELPRNTRLLIVGGTDDEGYAESLRELSREVGRAEHVLWMGHCDDEKSSLYLYAADICVLPFSMGVRLNNSSVAAAAAHGLPIVTTRDKELEDAFVDGENVLLCPPKDPAALAKVVNELIMRPELRSRLRVGAQRLTEQCFDADKIVNSTLRLLTDGQWGNYVEA